ncbi:MAG: hypothetical protein QM697_02115 [Lachnospiraceae bacterium]
MRAILEMIGSNQGYLYGILLFFCQAFLIIYFMHEMRRKERLLYKYIDKKLSVHGMAVSSAIEANQVPRASILSEEELHMLLTPLEEEKSVIKTERIEDDKLIEELLSEILSC